MGICSSIDDAALEAEFQFWKSQLVMSAWIGVAFAVAGGMLIAGWPVGVGDAQVRAFVQETWPPFVEAAFWTGFLTGFLLAAARRMGCALAGTVPWKKPTSPVRRYLGQTACCLGFGAISLWGAQQFVFHMAADQSALLHMLSQAVHTGFVLAGVCLLLAIGPGLVPGPER
ncbi:hypothetical protein [Noviherbaspirillum denitrificans]|uniref:Uncharacterized protein n=1 Tax=Noviherbaspirillum denitrificans TaxID=1968433 RepID=A0A254TMW1_9BURK|nr:hypothetical protein [Noviherbaspirillum denitrificans]OWW21048.1 hypothetical protein AYR66_17785 [Noviherbaspirillum denitrificans]